MEGEELRWSWPWKWRLLPLWLLLLCIYMAIKALVSLWWRPRKLGEHFAKQGIRGPPYRFFLGNVREIVGLMVEASSKPLVPLFSHNILPRVLPFYTHWKKLYGSTFLLLWFGSTARISVADPDLIREILVSRSQLYEKWESHPLIRQLEGDGLLSLAGEKWAHHRKVISPAFHMENLKLFVHEIGKTVVDMLEKWSAMSSSHGEIEIDVSEWFQCLAENAITQTAFGVSNDYGKAIFELQQKQMVFASEAFKSVPIPGYRFLPMKKNMESWKLGREVKKSLERLIRIRKENPDKGSAKDLMGLLINASTKEVTGRSGRPLGITVRDIVEECKTFFFAGKQTTFNLLTWATVMLAMHPEWQDKARGEVVQVCGSRDPPTKDHVTALKTLSMVMNETLRLYPPVVAIIRKARADVELDNYYKIPRGTELMISIMAVHHEPSLWGPDVHEFNPGRFAEGVARAATHPTAFIPFGLGARTCIGRNLALMEAKLTLAIILQRFSLRLSPTYVHSPTIQMLLAPQYGAPVIFTPISSCGSKS